MGTISLHSYNESSFDEGEPQMGTGFDEKLRPMSIGRSAARYNSDSEDSEDEDDDDEIFN